MSAEVILDAVRRHSATGEVPGVVVGVLRDGRLSLAAAGDLAEDTPVRISSMTKPVVAALATALVEDGALALDDLVERFVPELTGRRVLRRLDGPLDETVPADRRATVEDLLTMRLGFGAVPEGPCPAYDAAGGAGLGTGPPDPCLPLTPDGWVQAFATLPLLDQPGTTWRYDMSYGVLGVLLARAGGESLDRLLQARVLDPLGMTSTGFVAPPGRLPACLRRDGDGDGDRLVGFDPAGDGSRWARPPLFPDARGGLVSTAADLLAFAGALLHGGGPVLGDRSVRAMTTDHLTADQRDAPSAAPFLDGSGWGYGVQVSTPGVHPGVRAARYGWAGGLGTLWYSWPDHDAAAVLLTQVVPPSGPVFTAFVEAAEATLAPA